MGVDTFACPRASLRTDPMYWGKLLKFYGMYKKGHLPDVGAIVDQSNRAIEIFRILDEANDLCDAEQEKLANERRNRQAGRGAPPNGKRG